MTTTPSTRTEALRITLAARVFTLAALGASTEVVHQSDRSAFIAVAVIALCAQIASALPRIDAYVASFPEGCAVALIAAGASGTVAMPYLAVPVLVAGVLRSMRGVLSVLIVELAFFAVGLAVLPHPPGMAGVAHALVWLITGLGLGFLGSSIHRLILAQADERPYRDAVALMEQLHALSGRLSEGLDVASIAARLLDRADAALLFESAAVVTRAPSGTVTTLSGTSSAASGSLAEAMARVGEVWHSQAIWHNGPSIAVPLVRDERVIAVLVATSYDVSSSERIMRLGDDLKAEVLRLDAALMFADVTASAIHEERQRLAREVHDGLAQDVASLGYLIDGIDVRAHDADTRLIGIRNEITRVLQEVRHSVFGLRSDVCDERTLGDSVAVLAQHVRSHSPLRVHLTLDETPARLQADVEAQLLRIAQEAMNNARKHSGAANLWVHCRVDAPLAEIEVRDDGAGLGQGREDSYGLAIMRERAQRIGARLDIDGDPSPGHGTRVLVRLGGER